MPKKNLTELNGSNWDSEVKNSDKPVIVDFWAEWCAPCRMMEPIYEELASKYEGKMKFAKLNVDENPDVAEKYGIMAIPTMIIFKNGVEVERIIGALPKDKLEKIIKDNLA